MTQVNMLEAKSNLSRLVGMLEAGAEDKVLIARRGKPVAMLVLYEPNDLKPRTGSAKGLIPSVDFDVFDSFDDELVELFEGGDAL